MKKKLLVGVMLLVMLCSLSGCSSVITNFEIYDFLEVLSNFIMKPWENGGKAIEEYTWEEFERLSGVQQEAFFEAFESVEAFESWMNHVRPNEILPVEDTAPIEKPWENGGKAVEEYTWKEFEELNGAQQEAFFEVFESAEAFDSWMNRVHPSDTVPVEETMPIEKPWENGGKELEEYTWEEFEELSGAQQEAFFEAFESAEAFDLWMNRVLPSETLPVEKTMLIEKPWENGNKALEEYTWEEFEGLNGAQQEAFFESFESAEAFEAWMEAAQP